MGTVVLTLIVMIGMGFVFDFLISAAVCSVGSDCVGRVTHIKVGNARNSRYFHPVYSVDFEFVVNGVIHRGAQEVEMTGFNEQSVRTSDGGHTIIVRHLGLGPIELGQLPQFKSTWWNLGESGVFAILWALFFVFTLRAMVLPDMRVKTLLKNGKAVRATILSKRVVTDQPRGAGLKHRRFEYFVSYAFLDETTGLEIRTESKVESEAWEGVEQGQEVTAIYDPKNTKISVIYELSRYRVEGRPVQA